MHYLWEKRLFCFCTSCLLGKLAYWYLIASSFLYLLVFHFGQALDPEGEGDCNCQPLWILISCIECIWKWLPSFHRGWNLQTVSISLIGSKIVVFEYWTWKLMGREKMLNYNFGPWTFRFVSIYSLDFKKASNRSLNFQFCGQWISVVWFLYLWSLYYSSFFFFFNCEFIEHKILKVKYQIDTNLKV